MSAESPNKSNCHRGHTVSPQPVNDRSIIENVAGFINEVVPQGYSTTGPSEGKESIQWARFECGDINDPALYPESSDDHIATPPLLLVLGYGSGVQVWAIPASGEATEVLSSRQGVVRTLRILPTPRTAATTLDVFSHKRPLIALCDSAGPGPQFCSVSFISLRSGDQVKSIKFKNAVSDVLANQRVVVITFPERVAVFSALTLEDCMTVTTCYPCPGPSPNPVALGDRWLAYAERRLLPARRSSGGTEADGVQSYTATVLHAAKSFGKGLRELGETVASSLTGGPPQRGAAGVVLSSQQATGLVSGGVDTLQPGVITILDTQAQSPSSMRDQERVGGGGVGEFACSLPAGGSEMVAHFTAHSDAVVALAFDPSGMLLLTADKRGHDFHLFKIHPHPGGSSMAAVHHLYILHRGDTTAKVQGISFAADSRWVAVSTMRGTTHVFPITPYGGSVGVRTHASPHVVNRLSRFHRSAGLTADGRNSPVPLASWEAAPAVSPAMPHANPRLPPYPHPTVMGPLAQIRQPFAHTFLHSSSAPTSPNLASQQACRNPSLRTLGRTQSSSDEGLAGGGTPLKVAACFAPPRAWLVASPTVTRETSSKAYKRVVDSLFVMTCHGTLIEYDMEPRHAAGVPKEKVCDDTPIELYVEAKAQWLLLRPQHSMELQPPLPATNPLMALPERPVGPGDAGEERWLSQVEIVTHAGPHRRLWMGPQFTFKMYTTSSSSSLSLLEMDAMEVGATLGSRPARSNPVNMPLGTGATRPVVPVLIESGSASSYEQSPTLLEAYGVDGDSDGSAGPGELQLKEDLADAMLESPGVPTRDAGRRAVYKLRGDQVIKRSWSPIMKVVNPVGTVITVSLQSDDEEDCDIEPPNFEGNAPNVNSPLREPGSAVRLVRRPPRSPATVKQDVHGAGSDALLSAPDACEDVSSIATQHWQKILLSHDQVCLAGSSIQLTGVNTCILKGRQTGVPTDSTILGTLYNEELSQLCDESSLKHGAQGAAIRGVDSSAGLGQQLAGSQGHVQLEEADSNGNTGVCARTSGDQSTTVCAVDQAEVSSLCSAVVADDTDVKGDAKYCNSKLKKNRKLNGKNILEKYFSGKHAGPAGSELVKVKNSTKCSDVDEFSGGDVNLCEKEVSLQYSCKDKVELGCKGVPKCKRVVQEKRSSVLGYGRGAECMGVRDSVADDMPQGSSEGTGPMVQCTRSNRRPAEDSAGYCAALSAAEQVLEGNVISGVAPSLLISTETNDEGTATCESIVPKSTLNATSSQCSVHDELVDNTITKCTSETTSNDKLEGTTTTVGGEDLCSLDVLHTLDLSVHTTSKKIKKSKKKNR